MKKVTLYTLSLAIALVFNLNIAAAQSNYKLVSESTIEIEGTSTIHDWEAEAETINMNANFVDSVLQASLPASGDFIKTLSLTIPVKSIESGKGGMNSKIYGALKEKKHPNITYSFSSAELASTDEQADSFTLNTTGKLTIAGVTRTVNFPVEGKIIDGDSIRFDGSYKLNMTDYDVDPPSAVFGTIKSGEEVTITFNIVVANQTIANNK